MKKNLKTIFFDLIAAAFLLGLSSCDFFDSDDSDSDISKIFKGYSTVSATNTESWTYDSSKPVYVVNDNVLTLNISGDIGGKNLYFVQVNPTETAFESGDLRIVTKSSNFGSTFSSYYSVANRSVENSDIQNITIDESEIDSNLLGHKHFVGEKLPLISDFSSSARSAISSPSFDTSSTSAKKTWKIGDSKQIFIDTNTAMSNYEKRSATLRAKSDNCYVWVVDDYYSETASGCKADSSIAEEYAEKFEEMYPYITKVFGDESEEIINYDSGKNVDMSTLSDTGTKINIVVYDIGADYGSESSGGVVGYFYAKDYYYTAQTSSTYSGIDIISTIFGGGSSSDDSIISKSNVGKYFYVDSEYAVSDFDTTISTLAHEFQHMIDFNQKEMKHELSPETSYNEMLSMLCEDMMQEKLGLEDYASPKNRIQSFNAYYYMSGIREYLSGDYAALSYSTAYAFGSWLARQYGGAALVKEISQNAYVDNDSLVNAVNSVNGTSKTFDDLFAEFVLAVTGVSSSHNKTYTHNQNAKQTMTYETDSYKYPMSAFDIWSSASESYTSGEKEATYTFSLKGTQIQSSYQNFVYKQYDFNGPIVLSATAGLSGYDLRPEYGMLIHGVGKYASGTTSDTLTFSSSGAEGLQLYIVIQ